MSEPGRVCPLRYRYGAGAIAMAAPRDAETLYVIGGLYGNIPALDEIEAMAQAEVTAPTLCFNGDFNWFNIADRHFLDINRRVLAHDAILGNVEAEFDGDGDADDAGCGCAYPDDVDAGVVERSNRIHRQLKATALRHPELRERITRLLMFARYRIGDCRVGVVHGDADALAGWRFDVGTLDHPAELPWQQSVFAAANVDVFASTHTCLPAMRRIGLPTRHDGWVVNNGAAGMPNFKGDLSGLCTRIGRAPSPHRPLREIQLAGVHVALLPIRYDSNRWRADFQSQWPPGSPAWDSYFGRISQGPNFTPERAVPFAGHGHRQAD